MKAAGRTLTREIVSLFVFCFLYSMHSYGQDQVRHQSSIHRSPMRQSGFVSVINVGPETEEAFPEIKAFVSIQTPRGQDGTLTTEQLGVSEDGIVQRVTGLSSTAGSGTKVGIVFVFDDTGSMREEIAGMKSQASHFVSEVMTAGFSARFGLVTFKDDVTISLPLTENISDFQIAISELQHRGGGDNLEAALDAVMAANRMDFLPGERRVLILITDNRTHYRGDDSSDCDSEYLMSEVVDSLNINSTTLFAVSPYWMELNIHNDVRYLAQETGGIWLNIYSADFTEIIDQIGSIFTTLWELTYTTTNTTKDGSLRRVDVVVSDPDSGQGEHFNYYTAPLDTSQPVPIYLYAETPQYAADEFWIDIMIGDEDNPVNRLYGTALALWFDSDYLRIVSPTDANVIPGDFLGNPDEVRVLPPNVSGDTLFTAVTRIVPGTSVSGWGTILKVKFRVHEDTPDTTLVVRILDPVAVDPDWNLVSLTPVDFTLGIIGYITVWPGDTNNDGIVDQADMLPIGLSWGKMGFPREHADLVSWEAQPCRRWNEDARYTYADAYGDGTVDEGDVLVIGANWHKTPGMEKRSRTHMFPPGKGGMIQAFATEHASEATWDVDLRVTDVQHVLGMGIRFLYPAKESRVLSVEVGESMKGAPLFYYRIDAESGVVAIGISRTPTQGGLTGSGSVVRIRLSAESDRAMSMIGIGRVMGMDMSGRVLSFDVSNGPVSVHTVPETFTLSQNFPNPFNPMTTLRIELPQKTPVILCVYDMRGAEIATLMNQELETGAYEVVWHGRDASGRRVPSGIYYFRIKAGSFSCVRKGILLK